MKLKILLFLLILMPYAYAWQYATHQNIIEYVYMNLPLEKQQELNLTKLKQGAIMPDQVFKDQKLHHYPYSFIEAEKWLNNDSDLSLNIGIASHYITDTFAAPHNIAGETASQHSAFESQVKNYIPSVECRDYNFSLSDLRIATKNKKDWYSWLKRKDKSIPESEVDESAEFLFSIILKKLNTTCILKSEVTEVPYLSKNKIIAGSIVILAGVLYFLKS